MTGIAGICSLPPLDRQRADRLLTEMSQQISYRAQDHTDRWQNEHLAITRIHHGVGHSEAQPVFSEEGSLCAVLDGEVFGYDSAKKSLMQAGHRFSLQESDAEFCLHLYEERGMQALAALNGSFALALYDRSARELLLVSDRFLSRLLFYYVDGEQLLFGTQLHALLRAPQVPRSLDLQAVFEFFALQRVLHDRTFYQDIKVLPAASVLRFAAGQLSLARYWNAGSVTDRLPERHHVEALSDALRRSVARKTRGNHPLGLLLSGGLDARTVVAASQKPMTAFTFGDYENREVRTARRIAEAARFPHIYLQRSFDHYFNLVDEAVDIGDGMMRIDHAHAQGLFDEIRPHCDVLLDGSGFDIRLKGYWLLYRTIAWLGKKSYTPLLIKTTEAQSRDAWAGMRLCMFSSQPDRLFRSPYRSTFGEQVLSAICDLLATVEGKDLNHKVDRLLANGVFVRPSLSLTSMAVRMHVEQRSVVHDNDLLDVSSSIPLELRAKARVLKKALRNLSPELAAIPYANTGLRADMPVWPEWLLANGLEALRMFGVLRRAKQPHPAYRNGSWPNRGELIRTNEKLRTLIDDTLLDPASIPPDLFDVEAVRGLWQEHLNRDADHFEQLFLLLTFGRWHEKYGPS